MPKVRERSRITQDFAVTPWQTKREISKETPQDALYVVEEAFLLAPTLSAAAACPPTVPRDRPAIAMTPPEEGIDTSEWFTKVPRPALAGPSQVTFEFAQPATKTRVASPTRGSKGDARDSPGYTPVHMVRSHRRRREGDVPAALAGLCQLAITPAGRGMGHIFVVGAGAGAARGGGSSRLRGGPEPPEPRCYGLAVRPVPPGVPADPCTDDDSSDLLCARVTDFTAGGANVDVLVARTGGDMCRLAPPDEELLRRWFGDAVQSDSDDEARARRDAGVRGMRLGGWDDDDEEEEEEDEKRYKHGDGLGEGEQEDEEAGAGACGDGDEVEEAGPGARAVGSAGEEGAAAGPQSAREWLGLWRRQRLRRPALELRFEPETMLSGSAAMPKLVEFAKPLLPPRLAGSASGDFWRLDGGADGAAAASGGGAAGGTGSADRMDLTQPYGRPGGAAGAQTMDSGSWAGAQAATEGGAREDDGADVDAVVCLGPVTLSGLILSLQGRLGKPTSGFWATDAEEPSETL